MVMQQERDGGRGTRETERKKKEIREKGTIVIAIRNFKKG